MHSVNFKEIFRFFDFNFSSDLIMRLLFFFIVCAVSACSSNTEICSCLEAGKQLEHFSSELLQRDVTKSDVIQMKKLKAEQQTKCADFQTMDGKKMLELKEECEEK